MSVTTLYCACFVNVVMPLLIDVFDGGNWRRVGQLNPQDTPGSISNIIAPAKPQVVAFLCKPDGVSSEVYICHTPGLFLTESIRVIDLTRFRLEKVLSALDAPYEITVKTEKSPVARRMRFSHVLNN